MKLNNPEMDGMRKTVGYQNTSIKEEMNMEKDIKDRINNNKVMCYGHLKGATNNFRH